MLAQENRGPRGVFVLILLNILVYFLQGVRPDMISLFSLDFSAVLYKFQFWRLFTYTFFHGTSFMYLFFNMLVLYWTGVGIEQYWGRKLFFYFYFFCGIIAGLCVVLADFIFSLFGIQTSLSFGSTASVFACFLVYGVVMPDAGVLFFFILPTTMRRLLFFSIMLGAFWLVWEILGGLFRGWAGSLLFSAGYFGAILGVWLFLKIFYKKNYEVARTKMSFEDEADLFFVTLRLKKKSSDWSSKPSFWKRIFSRKDGGLNLGFDEKRMSPHQIESLIDELLGKISRKGLKKLSVEEREFLERVSKEYKHKFPD